MLLSMYLADEFIRMDNSLFLSQFFLMTKPNHEMLKMKNLSPALFWAARVQSFPPELAANLIERYEHLQQFQDGGFIKRNSKTDPYRKSLSQFSIGENIHRAPFHLVLYLWMKSHFPQYVLGAEGLDMAYAVELRLPFLDHELFGVTKKLPAS